MSNDKMLKENLQDLELTIKKMPCKTKSIFTEWIKVKNSYLKYESTFNPKYLRAYKRGEVIFVHFGFNVGTEYGGAHYAAIIRDSSKANPNINVVPLTSVKNDNKEFIHKDRILLGVIEGLNASESIAIPDQIRPISKLRVIKPKNQSHSVFKLSSEQIDMIDDKIRRLYTKI